VARAIFGVRLDEVTSQDELVRACIGFLEGDRARRIFTPNPEILLRARDDPSYAELLNTADLALPDGTGVAMVESLRRRRRVRRWPGVEIGALLLRLASDRDLPVAFVGGLDGVGERAAAEWQRRVPSLSVSLAGAGVPFDDDGHARTNAGDDEVVGDLQRTAPAIVLVGLGAPKQERWIDEHADDIPSARILIGVGGAFDMWAGRLRRAPRLLHRVGLEWAWRLALEPGRFSRIVRATVVFPFHALTDRPG
jgi:N-acetylglucosaminyldiphosphoundecaprenol N-acetyl-beta-D-mannosaminyltransferase